MYAPHSRTLQLTATDAESLPSMTLSSDRVPSPLPARRLPLVSPVAVPCSSVRPHHPTSDRQLSAVNTRQDVQPEDAIQSGSVGQVSGRWR